jgi:hypothetical protein
MIDNLKRLLNCFPGSLNIRTDWLHTVVLERVHEQMILSVRFETPTKPCQNFFRLYLLDSFGEFGKLPQDFPRAHMTFVSLNHSGSAAFAMQGNPTLQPLGAYIVSVAF